MGGRLASIGVRCLASEFSGQRLRLPRLFAVGVFFGLPIRFLARPLLILVAARPLFVRDVVVRQDLAHSVFATFARVGNVLLRVGADSIEDAGVVGDVDAAGTGLVRAIVGNGLADRTRHVGARGVVPSGADIRIVGGVRILLAQGGIQLLALFRSQVLLIVLVA